jgi:aminodeoxyfutalosine synthase
VLGSGAGHRARRRLDRRRGSLDSAHLWLTAAVTFWTAGFDVIYACQDYEFDCAEGCFSVPRAIRHCRRAVGGAGVCTLAMIACLLALVFFARPGRVALAGVAVVAACSSYEHSLVNPDDLSRVDAAFFTMNGYMSVLFFEFLGRRYLPAMDGCLIIMQVRIRRPASCPIRGEGEAGERLSFDDGLALYRSADMLAVGLHGQPGARAPARQRRLFQRQPPHQPDRRLRGQLPLCAFGKRVRDPKAYTMSLEEVWQRAGEGYTKAVTEFHIVGGLHPELTVDWYCEMLRGLKQRFPRVHLKAFTMVEIAYLARRTKIRVRGSRWSGCATPAWIPARRRRRDLQRARPAHHLRSQDRWQRVARNRPRRAPVGLRSNCTMLYGHIENEEDRVDHLVRLRELQDETGGFVTFIPLAFHPDNTPLQHIPRTTGFATSRTSPWRA